jgi:hypothetical protein
LEDRKKFCPQSSLATPQRGIECMKKHFGDFGQKCHEMISTMHTMMLRQDRFKDDKERAVDVTFALLEKEFFDTLTKEAQKAQRASEL